jgi:hypothetical protein
MRQQQLLTQTLLTGAATLGLPPRDVANAAEMFEKGEWHLGFDIIVQQLYEYEVEITTEFFQLIGQTAACLRMPLAEYLFTKRLIRSPEHIPEPVKTHLASLLNQLAHRNS